MSWKFEWGSLHTGRTATCVIAAADAPATEKAQADYVCIGLGASSISNGSNGVLTTSPTQLGSYNHKLSVKTAGDFNITLAAGVTATLYRMELVEGTYNIPISTLGLVYFYVKDLGGPHCLDRYHSRLRCDPAILAM